MSDEPFVIDMIDSAAHAFHESALKYKKLTGQEIKIALISLTPRDIERLRAETYGDAAFAEFHDLGIRFANNLEEVGKYHKVPIIIDYFAQRHGTVNLIHSPRTQIEEVLRSVPIPALQTVFPAVSIWTRVSMFPGQRVFSSLANRIVTLERYTLPVFWGEINIRMAYHQEADMLLVQKNSRVSQKQHEVMTRELWTP